MSDQFAGDYYSPIQYFGNCYGICICGNGCGKYHPIDEGFDVQKYNATTETKSLKVKKLDPKAILPSKVRDSDEGYDISTFSDIYIDAGETQKIHTGIALGLPEGYWGELEARSSLAAKGITVYGGVIDNTYIGEIIVCLHNSNPFGSISINAGSKIAQIVLHKHRHFDIVEVDTLEETDRNDKGFGSSGQ